MQSTQLGCTVVFGGGPGGLQWYTQNWWQEKKGLPADLRRNDGKKIKRETDFPN